MIEIGSPTSKPCGYKGPNTLFLRSVPCVRFQFRDFPRGARKTAVQYGGVPRQASLLALPGRDVRAQRVLVHDVKMFSDEVEDFLIPKPLACVPMDLDRGRIKDDYVAAIFEGPYILGESPSIGQDRHLTRGLERLRHALLLKGVSERMPTDSLLLIGLAECFEQSDALAITG
jgi:hypothetical protein